MGDKFLCLNHVVAQLHGVGNTYTDGVQILIEKQSNTSDIQIIRLLKKNLLLSYWVCITLCLENVCATTLLAATTRYPSESAVLTCSPRSAVP